MALFKIEISWTSDGFHILHENGLEQIVHYYEHTIQGALCEDIAALFNQDLYHAIMECPIRKEEVLKGMPRTKCVSMTFTTTGDGSIILALDLERSVGIRQALYPTILSLGPP